MTAFDPRRQFGSACQLGVLGGIPTIGVGKTLHRLDGIGKADVAAASATLRTVGESAPLVGASGRVWGAVLRTTDPAGTAFKPVLVSVGHGLRLDAALQIVRACTRCRIPEPVRQADLRSRAWLRASATPERKSVSVSRIAVCSLHTLSHSMSTSRLTRGSEGEGHS